MSVHSREPSSGWLPLARSRVVHSAPSSLERCSTVSILRSRHHSAPSPKSRLLHASSSAYLPKSLSQAVVQHDLHGRDRWRCTWPGSSRRNLYPPSGASSVDETTPPSSMPADASRSEYRQTPRHAPLWRNCEQSSPRDLLTGGLETLPALCPQAV